MPQNCSSRVLHARWRDAAVAGARTRRARRGVAVVSLAGAFAAAGCGAADPATTRPDGSTRGAPRTVAAAGGPARFDPTRFSDPTRIDNAWFPLAAGTEYVYEGRSNRGSGRRPHRVLTTVTDLTKVVDGVRARVLWERDINAGQLLEGELAFHAQADDGTVWNFGEYPEEYEPGRPARAPDTWISGRAGARPGVLMPARPRPGTASYLQGWAPTIEFADRARILASGDRTCVPVRCFSGVLVTDEWNPTEPGQHQRKYYARGIGTVRVGAVGRGEGETLVLTTVRRLGGAEMAAVRRAALRLDRRAYRTRERLYGATPPARQEETAP